MTAPLFTRLHAYYDSKGIGAVNFGCPHEDACRGGSETFSTAKEAYVGARYGMDGVPRLVFLSLDSGDGGEDAASAGAAAKRTLEELQAHEERVQIDKLARGRHWYQTRVLALRLLESFKRDLEIKDIHRYFAHTNSAKCCLNKKGRREADARLFDNCRAYIPGELEILAPQILVTQGTWARQAVREGCAGRFGDKIPGPMSAGAYRMLSLTGPDSTIWFHSYHPSSYGRYWIQTKRDWSGWTEAVQARLA